MIASMPATVPSATWPYGVPRKMFVCSRSLPSSSSLFERRSCDERVQLRVLERA